MIVAMFLVRLLAWLSIVLILGEEVKAGQIVAKIHNIERTGSSSKEYFAGIDGIYTGRHFPGLITAGDFLGVISVPI